MSLKNTPTIHPLVRFAVERRVTMTMLLIGVLVLGWLSLVRLPLEFLPAVSSSNVSISISYPSASPQEVAEQIVRPLEDSLGTLNDLEGLSSSASSGEARLDVTFLDGTDMDLATVEVRDRVDRVRHRLPDDLRRIRIRRFQTSDIPVLRFHLASDWSKDRLNDFAERIVLKRLERLPGVAQVQIRGLQTKQVQIRLDADRMAAHGVDARALATLLRENHLDVSGGHLDEGRRRFLVRVLGQLRSLDDIRQLPIGTGLRLEDVAEVVYAYPRQENFNFLNGEEALSVRVYKTSDANLLDVVDRSKEELDALTADPRFAGHTSRIYGDASKDVRQGLSQLRDAGLLGGLLAVAAVFFFLRQWRTTTLVAIAIPVSVVLTFVFMFLVRTTGRVELTLNVVSLMGLVIALGMLVDSSIVVIESIYRRLEIYGEDAKTAALRGASEVALPIVASTVTTLCVFIPMIFLRQSGGFFARYLTEIGTTVCIVMVAAMLVALTLVPMTASLVLEQKERKPTRLIEVLEKLYMAFLGGALRYRAVLLLVAGGLLWGSWQLFSGIERSFMGRSEARQVTIHVDVPPSYSLEQTASLFDELLETLDGKRADLDIADITSSYFIGSGRSRGRGRERQLELYLVDEEAGTLTTRDVRDRVRRLLPQKPGVELRIAQSRRRGGGSGGLDLELRGDDLAALERLGRKVAEQIRAFPGIEDVDLSLESGDQELWVEVDRARAVDAGLSTRSVAQSVQSALSDRSLSYLSADDREIDLVMLYRGEAEATRGDLENLRLESRQDLRALSSVADFATVAGPRAIERENRQAKIRISANSEDGRALGRAMGGVRMLLASTPMPPGYSWSFGRWTRMSQSDQEGSDFTLLFALLLVYLVMAALFESFGQPLSIMLAVPFAFIGVGAVMKLASQPRDNLTELGFIVLIGVVVNNAIVLVDHINRLRSNGLERRRAIIEGGRDRLRAILMTAVTTIVGLLPMVAPVLLPQVFGPLEGRAATWAPVGLVILGGLTTSTFLTLVIVPTFYSLIDDVASFLRRTAIRAFRHPVASQPAPED
ncbi:MAG: efflux RND transporter permease subunit [Acidobacteriota bacterium]